MANPNQLVIQNVQIVYGADALTGRVDIVVEEGTINAILPAGDSPHDADVLDGGGCYAMPGLVNAHTHSHNALSKGFGDAWSLELLLNYGPALNARRTPDDHYWATLLNGLEMLKSGATAAYDLVIHQPLPTIDTLAAVVLAYRDLGMRAVVAPAIADMPFYEIVPGLLESLPDDLRSTLEGMLPAAGDTILANVREALDTIGRDELVRLAVAPTIPTQCSDEFLLASYKLAEEFDTGLHTHLSESKIQAVDGLRRYGSTTTAHLAELGILSPRFVAAHGVWLNSDDTEILASHGAMIAHNPASNLRLGSGVAPVRKFLDGGVTVGLGTDGSASSDNQNMFEAMRFAGHSSRLYSHNPDDWLSTGNVLHAATAGGAQCCELGHGAGRLELGAPADIVLLDQHSTYLTPANDLPTQLVGSETGSAVRTVIVAGNVILDDGVSSRVDEQSVYDNASRAAERLRVSNVAEWEFARRLNPFIVATCSQLARRHVGVERLLVAAEH